MWLFCASLGAALAESVYQAGQSISFFDQVALIAHDQAWRRGAVLRERLVVGDCRFYEGPEQPSDEEPRENRIAYCCLHGCGAMGEHLRCGHLAP